MFSRGIRSTPPTRDAHMQAWRRVPPSGASTAPRAPTASSFGSCAWVGRNSKQQDPASPLDFALHERRQTMARDVVLDERLLDLVSLQPSALEKVRIELEAAHVLVDEGTLARPTPSVEPIDSRGASGRRTAARRRSKRGTRRRAAASETTCGVHQPAPPPYPFDALLEPTRICGREEVERIADRAKAPAQQTCAAGTNPITFTPASAHLARTSSALASVPGSGARHVHRNSAP